MIDLEAFLQELLIGGAYIEEGRLRVPASGLSAEKLALLEELQSEILHLLPTYSFEMPLSYGQEGLWVVHQNAPNKAAYNTAVVLHLQSAVDKALLRDIFQKIGQRHSALRTTIAVRNGEPKQVIAAKQALCFEEVDCSGQSWEMVMQAVEEALKPPFDLSEGPLWRVTLVSQSPDSHALLLSFHHIIFDGWSIWMLVDEFLALAGAAENEEPVNLPPIKGTYPQFVPWQREMLDTHGEGLAAYWQDALGGELPVLDLPTDYRRPKVTTSQTDSLPFNLSSSWRDQLRALARREGVSFYTVLLAALQILLARYQQNAERILVGVPTAGREREAFAQTFGYFVNMVVVDATLTDVPFTTFLQQVRAKLLGAIKHRAYPFPWVVNDLQTACPLGIERDPSRGPIYQASLVVQRPQKLSQETLRLLKGEQVELTSGLLLQFRSWLQTTGELDLMFDLMEHTTPEGVVGYIRYRSDLFSEHTIKRMGQHYQQLLKAVVHDATQGIYQLPMLTDAEYHQIVHEWNDTAVDFGEPQTMHALFEQQVERTPEAIAVVFADQQLTYHELNTRANQLAHYLIAQGVGPEVLVGICVERSLEMVVGLLGILKAGGAYVPLDPEYPPERLQFMLDDANVKLFLTEHKLASTWPQALQQLYLDQNWWYGPNHSNPITQVKADHLAYCMYTSGSTGRPKGVMVEHRHVQALLSGFEVIAPKNKKLIGTSVCPFGFDVSVWELFSILCFGGTLHILSLDILADSKRLANYLLTNQVTSLYVPPTLLSELVTELETLKNKIYLDRMLVGVEPIKQGLLQRFRDLSDDLRIINGYGPTESTVCATFFNFKSALDPNRRAPIGKAVANYQVYLVNEYLQPVPLGVPGELHIGGAGVARGYLNRPQLTDEAFIPNPFGPGRLYKTGDLCRYLPESCGAGSGNIEFLGRADHQVKIRGFRIELGEIESTLSSQPNVREVVVVVREEGANSPKHALTKEGSTLARRLVAYIVADVALDVAELRDKVRQQLPDYMIPSAFVQLEAMPLTPNGKIDRRALSALDMSALLSEDTFVPPSTPTEIALANIWSEVLGIEQIGIHDNFFELGGHSLLATQVISQVRAQLNIEVLLNTIFEAPQLAAFARNISQTEQSTTATIRSVPRDGQLPLSFAQQRLWFLDQLEPNSALYNIPALVRLQGQLDVVALEQSFSYLISRHESLRTTFDTVGGEPMQVIHAPSAFRLSVIAASDKQAQKLGLAEATTPFNLNEGPLLRAQLLKAADEIHWLLLNMHHIISDGWSMGVLINELIHAYTAYAQGDVPTLPDLPIQYADFALWQRNYLSDERLSSQLSFWRSSLLGAPPLLELPTDRPRPPVQSYHGAHYTFHLNGELTTKLNQLAVLNDATLFMVSLSAFNVLLSRYSRQTDIVVGSPIANRNHAEIEGLIGFFVNTLALRTKLDDNPTFSELLSRVRQTTLAGYEHQDLPFEQLVDELQLERTLSYAPLFQVMFVLQNAPLGSFALSGLHATMALPEFPFAKFDLTLNLIEGDEGLEGMLEYSTDLFDEATIARMASHFEVLLNSIVSHPHLPVLQLPMLTEAEYHQIVHEWNETAVDFGQPQTIHAMFEAQVRRTPDAVALVFEDQQLTYRELNARANQLAHHLISLGVQADTLVAVAMERSLEMVVSLLAVLKAGGAYVPIDPTYPRERIRYILTDCAAPILLTQRKLELELSYDTGHVIAVDRVGAIYAQSTLNPREQTLPEDLAYVIYTSGSTGQPKGVMIQHSQVLAMLSAYEQIAPLHRNLRGTSVCPYNFDVSVWEFFSQLCFGGTLHLLTISTVSVEDLVNYLSTHRITSAYLPPMLLTEIARTYSRSQKRITLKRILVGVEPIAQGVLQRFRDLSPEIQIINGYGPTECTICSSFYEFNVAVEPERRTPIGKPLANYQIYLCDANLQPVPIGVSGEILIGGAGVGRGYLNRPQLTADKFIVNPFAPKGAERLYKTGDLARWLPDGNIEFLGRADYQVKIRGFRIELGEIESLLNSQPNVRQVVVVAREEGANKGLVAYIVADVAHNVAELRDKLRQQLPDYMIPSAFVQLETMPLTPNGKIDRRALPAPDMSALLSEETFVPPGTPTEIALATIWSEVLGIEEACSEDRRRIGIQDNFFELGGHSLLATQVVSRMRDMLQTDIPLRLLFEHPTISGLLAQIRMMETLRRMSQSNKVQKSEDTLKVEEEW